MSILLNGRQHLYQWDTNQKVLLDEYPESTEAHFYLNRPGFISKGTTDVLDAPIALAYEQDGHKCADIPNVLLQESGELYVYICTSNSDEFYTNTRVSIKVQPREKPSGYVFPGNSATTSLTWGDLCGQTS